MTGLPRDKKIILFDGVCTLCDKSVQFVIRHDKHDKFRFVAQQSELGQEIMSYLGINPVSTESIVLYEPGHAYYTKAEAAIRIVKALGGWFTLMSVFLVFPDLITNNVYSYIAKNRYKWYGKKSECTVPTPEVRAKFL